MTFNYIFLRDRAEQITQFFLTFITHHFIKLQQNLFKYNFLVQIYNVSFIWELNQNNYFSFLNSRRCIVHLVVTVGSISCQNIVKAIVLFFSFEMAIHSIYILSKSGGLIYQYDHIASNIVVEKTFNYPLDIQLSEQNKRICVAFGQR